MAVAALDRYESVREEIRDVGRELDSPRRVDGCHESRCVAMHGRTRGVPFAGQHAESQVELTVRALDDPGIVAGVHDCAAATGGGGEGIADSLRCGIVEVCGGFVEDDDPWLPHQRARDRESLLLPARHLVGTVGDAMFELE